MIKLVLVLSVMIFWPSPLSMSGARSFRIQNTPSRAGCNYIPPGIWSCSTRKRSTLDEQQTELESVKFQKRQNPNCPPGVWSCKLGKQNKFDDQDREYDSVVKKRQNPNCPPGVWSCKLRIQKFDDQVREFDSSQLQKRQNPNCPPGVWSCKLRKRMLPDYQLPEMITFDQMKE